MVNRTWTAVTVIGALVGLGASSAIFGACSPTASLPDSGTDNPVCDPTAADPLAGCACDPSTFKTSDCYTGPAGTNAKGICKTGKRSCTPQGTYTRCDGQVTPLPETCNYADDDCNGFVDDLPEINDAAVIAKCNSPACDPDFTDAAITCWGPDPGICGAGRKGCAGGPAGGTPTGCIEFIHTPAPEVCNGVDDDCNGTVDDGLDNEGACDMPNQSEWGDANPFDGGVPSKVLGECVHGQLGCVDGGDLCFPSQPQTEVQLYGGGCDGLDNDCDGITDNHSCSDSYDKQYKQDYCCTDGYYFQCDVKSSIDAGYYTSCKLAN